MIPDIAPTTYSNVGTQADPMIPGLNQSYDTSQKTPLLTVNQSWWDDAKQMGSDFWTASGHLGQDLEGVVEEVYTKGSSAIGTVLKDASSGIAGATNTLLQPVEGAVSFSIFNILLVVGVLGVALYYTGKSGGLRVAI